MRKLSSVCVCMCIQVHAWSRWQVLVQKMTAPSGVHLWELPSPRYGSTRGCVLARTEAGCHIISYISLSWVCTQALLCVLCPVCVCVCSNSNTLWQNDHTLLPTAPRNLSSALLPPSTPEEGCAFTCMSALVSCGQRRSFASMSVLPLFFVPSAMPASSQEPLWHLTTKSTASSDGTTHGRHDMMALSRSVHLASWKLV